MELPHIILEWKKEYCRLKQKVNNNQLNFQNLLNFSKNSNIKKEINFLIEFQEKKQFEYEKESNKINISIIKFYEDVDEIKKKLKNYEKTPEYLKNLRDTTEKVEEKFSSFKQIQMENYEKIMNEEMNLDQDLNLFEEKLKEYESINDNNIDDIKPKKEINFKNDETDEILTELKNRIISIDKKIIEIGGRTCKWKDVDHNVFLKIKSRHKNNIDSEAFISDCCANLPIFDEQAILDHIEAFKEYEKLDLAKKEIILTYNQRKIEIQEEIIFQNESKEENKKSINKKDQKKLLEKQKQENEKKKATVQSWKAKKSSKSEVQKEREEKEKAERRIKQLEREREELKQKKKAIQEYKERKLLEKAEEEFEKEKIKAKNKLKSEDLERIKKKEARMVERKLHYKMLKETKKKLEEEKEMRFTVSKAIKYAYVEPKLTDPTKAYESRKRTKFEYKEGDKKYGDNFGGEFLRTTGRAIPGWRQGM